jgi:hypothetical protein
VALATVTWLAMLWTVATAGRLEPRVGASSAVVGEPDASRPSAPALT